MVQEFQFKTGSEVTSVLINYDHSQVGTKFKADNIVDNIQKLCLSADMRRIGKNKAADNSLSH